MTRDPATVRAAEQQQGEGLVPAEVMVRRFFFFFILLSFSPHSCSPLESAEAVHQRQRVDVIYPLRQWASRRDAATCL